MNGESKYDSRRHCLRRDCRPHHGVHLLGRLRDLLRSGHGLPVMGGNCDPEGRQRRKLKAPAFEGTLEPENWLKGEQYEKSFTPDFNIIMEVRQHGK